MNPSVVAPSGYATNNPYPEISRYYNKSGTPYTNTAQVISEVLIGVRYIGQTFLVVDEEWWFKSGKLDTDLVLKQDSGTGELVSKFTSNPTYTIVDDKIVIPAGETWLIDSVPYTNPSIIEIPFDYAVSGYLYFLSIVATKFNTFVGKVGTQSTVSPSEPTINSDELLLTTVLISDLTLDVITPPVTSDIYVEKATLNPFLFIGTGEIGTVGMDKRSAISILGSVTKLGNISKNNSNHFIIGQPFVTNNKTTGIVEFPHMYLVGGSDVIPFFNPEVESYFAKINESTIWIADIIDGQRVYRRATSSLQNESVTLEKLAKMPAKTFIGNAGNSEAIPQHIDKIDALEILGLENASSDIETLKTDKANQSTTYTKLEVDGMVSSTFKPKGSVANFSSLPTTGNREGDVWNVIDTGDNYVWVLNLNNTGVAGWDKQSGTVDLTAYETKVVAEGKYLQIANASATVLATLLTGISFLTGGAIVSTDSVLVAFGKIQKQINDIGTALGLKQDTLTDLNFGTFTNSVATKNTQADTDILAYVDVLTGKWVKQPFSKLVNYLKGFFQTSRIIVTSDITAVNGSVYHNNGNNTFTDPTPENNKGFYVLNIVGSPIIGGNTYSVGTYVFRYYDGTNWINNTIKKGVSNAIYSANKTLTPMDNNDTIFMDSGTLTVNPTSQSYQNGYTIAVASSGSSNTPLVLQSATDWSYVINANASILSGSVFIEKGGTATIVRKANLKIFQINGSVI